MNFRRKNIYFPINCFYCDFEIQSKFFHTYDHIVPLANGGKDSFDNLVDCCQRCNRIKADKTLEQFYFEIEKQLLTMGSKAPEFNYFTQIVLHLKPFIKNI